MDNGAIGSTTTDRTTTVKATGMQDAMGKAFKTLLAVVLVLGLMPSLRVESAFASEASEDAEACADDAEVAESGEVYQIDSEADLVEFAQVVNGYTDEDGNTVEAEPDAVATVTTDFELSSGVLPSIGTDSSTGFSGTIYGNGYTISGITDVESYALVDYLAGGTIEDLTLEGELENAYSAFVYMAQSGTISGCTNDVDITTSKLGAGGIVYMLNVASGDELTISGCTNSASVTSTYYGSSIMATTEIGVGGIAAGSSSFRGTVTITECENAGDVTGMNVGGIVGSLYTGKTGATVNISECANTGDVYSTGPSGGGILGTAGYSTGTRCSIYISDSYNVGTVTVDSTSTSQSSGYGGIAGTVRSYSAKYVISICDSYNAGALVYEGTAELDLGAIVGMNGSTSTKKIDFSNVYYLEGTASSAIGDGNTTYDGDDPVSVTTGGLHVLEYTLASGSESGSDAWQSGCVYGYPVLEWQEGSAHTFDADDIVWTWADDYSYATATIECADCDGSTVELEVTVTYESTDGTDCTTGITVTATATATLPDGSGTASVTVQNVTLPATGHSWEVSNWSWSDDMGSATLTLTCSVCGETVDVEATVSTVTVEATCLQAGSTTYTATATYDDVEYSDSVTVALETSGHSWEVSSWTWSDSYDEATLTLSCSVCGETVDVDADVVRTVSSEGVSYTATATYDDVEYSDSVSVSFSVTRIGGTNRYETAALEALEAYDSADVVVLATGENFPDSLAVTSLAGALDAPILLTKTDSLSDAAAEAIAELGAGKVIIVGGESAVSSAVFEELAESGLAVERVYGSNRYETAEAIYTYGLTAGSDGGSVWGDTVVVASGANYADALSVSSLAYSQCWPILLADSDGELKESTVDLLTSAAADGVIAGAVVVGGTGVVSETAEGFVETLLGEGSVDRLGGSNRYATSVLIAGYAVEGGYLSWDGAVFASGANYPDALAGSAVAGTSGSVLLLVADGKTSAAEGALEDVASQIVSVNVLGGYSAVPDSVVDAVVSALEWGSYDYVHVGVE